MQTAAAVENGCLRVVRNETGALVVADVTLCAAQHLADADGQEAGAGKLGTVSLVRMAGARRDGEHQRQDFQQAIIHELVSPLSWRDEKNLDAAIERGPVEVADRAWHRLEHFLDVGGVPALLRGHAPAGEVQLRPVRPGLGRSHVRHFHVELFSQRVGIGLIDGSGAVAVRKRDDLAEEQVAHLVPVQGGQRIACAGHDHDFGKRNERKRQQRREGDAV